MDILRFLIRAHLVHPMLLERQEHGLILQPDLVEHRNNCTAVDALLLLHLVNSDSWRLQGRYLRH